MKVPRARAGPDGALFIESIEPNKSLTSTKTCLELLIVSFSQSFSLRPKQAAGLMTQGGKYLAHIIVKGLKGQYEPVVKWYQALFAVLKHLMGLIVKEEVNGSVSLILSTLRPGLLSRNLEVCQWTCRVFARLGKDMQEKELLAVAWEVRLTQWFSAPSGGIDACIVATTRFGLDIKYSSISILAQFCQGHFSETFTVQFRMYLPDPLPYLTLVDECLPVLFDIKPARDELFASQVIDFWLEFAQKETEGEGKKPIGGRFAAIALLCSLWLRFPAKIEESDETADAILTAIKRILREKSQLMRVFAT